MYIYEMLVVTDNPIAVAICFLRPRLAVSPSDEISLRLALVHKNASGHRSFSTEKARDPASRRRLWPAQARKSLACPPFRIRPSARPDATPGLLSSPARRDPFC